MAKIYNNSDIFWIFIPARSGSKTIKDKNIIRFKGKPLLAHSIISGKKIKLGKVVVSSDSNKYLKIAKKFGADLLHLRPKKYSKDKSSDLEVFRNFLIYLKKENIKPPKYFVHLRPTTPVRRTNTLKKAIKIFLTKKNKITAMRSVNEMSNPSQKTMKIRNNKLCSVINNNFNLDKFNQPKENFEKTYLPNGYIDIVLTKNIKKKIFHGNKVLPFIINEFNSDIDSKDDLKYVKYRIR
jgi:CMP-N,N'-diacetyllegionaminic acid synthase